MYFVSTALSGFVSGLLGGDGDHAARLIFLKTETREGRAATYLYPNG